MIEDDGQPLPIIRREPGVPPTVENSPAPAFGDPEPEPKPAPLSPPKPTADKPDA